MEREGDELALGIDIGGTKILTAVADAQGRMLSGDYSRTRAEEGVQAVVSSVLESAGRSLEQAHISAAELSAIGIGAAGLSNPETGILFTSPNLPGWEDVPLRDIVEREFGRKAFLINDANAAALGELYFGAARGARNFVYITIGTGIGGGIIIDGKIYTGSAGIAGEVGHMVVDDDGAQCNCGSRGCWETLASGTAMEREARGAIERGAQTSILKYADGKIENIGAKAIEKAARAGDKLANELISRTAYYLGVGLANLINIFNPELIVIGGGLSNIGDMLLTPAFHEAERRAFKQAYGGVRFARAELGANSSVLGAAAFALGEVRREEQGALRE
jgi:glucokinase